MYPVHDAEAILLLSLSVAAKRGPADLERIITAIELEQGAIPSAKKLSDAFARLSICGLIVEIDGSYTLSANAQAMMEGQRKKDDFARKMVRLKEQLAAFQPPGEQATIALSPAQISKAIDANKVNQAPARNPAPHKAKPAWVPKKELARGAKLPPSKRRRK